MKQILIVLLAFLLFVPFVKAAPVITNVTIVPDNAWLGEDVTLSSNCYDAVNSIIKVQANITGPDIMFSNNLTNESGIYTLTLQNYHLPRQGRYDAVISCENDVHEIADPASKSFVVSVLSSYVAPVTGYIGSDLEIDAIVKKDDGQDNIPLPSGVAFTVYLDDQVKSLKQDPPIYDTNKGWILLIDSPSSVGKYNLRVNADYDRSNTSSSSTADILEPLQFDLTDVSNRDLKAGENVTLTTKTLYKGSAINIIPDNLQCSIGSTSCNIIEIRKSGDNYLIIIPAPDITPGVYTLTLKLTYVTFIKEVSTTVNYVVPVQGRVLDSSSNAVYVRMKFIGNGTERTIATDNSGSYSGYIPPGMYNIEIAFPSSKLYLSDVMINDFNDPVKFDHLTTGVSMPGVGFSDVFVYEAALMYSGVHLEMSYDDSKIINEARMEIYKCANWNLGRKICNSEWNKMNANIDTIRNKVSMNLTSLSAFIIGYRKDMSMTFELDKDQYALSDIIKVIGTIEDEDKTPVEDAQVVIKVDDLSANTRSGSNGVFSVEFQGPNKEGTFDVLVTAARQPFASVNGTTRIKVVKSEGISIVMKDTVRIKQGGHEFVEFSVVNTGQKDFSNISLSLSGVPKGLFVLPKTDLLVAKEEKKLSIEFDIPTDADKTTYAAALKVIAGNITAEYKFALTILPINYTSSGGIGLPSVFTGQFVLPTVSGDVIYVLVFGVVALTVSFLLRKRKKNMDRADVKNLLLDIRREIERQIRR